MMYEGRHIYVVFQECLLTNLALFIVHFCKVQQDTHWSACFEVRMRITHIRGLTYANP